MSMKTAEQIASEHAVKVATYSDPNEETGLLEPIIESQDDLARIIAAAIADDRAQQQPIVTETDPHSMSLPTSRTVTPKEIVDLVFGTGALTWSWWRNAHIVTIHEDTTEPNVVARTAEENERINEWYDPETTRVQLRHFSAESEDQLATSRISFPQLVRAAAEVLEDREGGDVDDMKTDSLGYADAVLGDSILQRAVFGETIYG